MCACFDDEQYEPNELYKNVPKYSAPTLMGNWFNEQAIEEANLDLINFKRKNGQLLSDRLKRVMGNLLSSVTLSSCIQSLEHNKVYQIYNSHVATTINESYPYENRGLFLSGTLTERQLDQSIHLGHGCVVTASAIQMPCKRNTWTFKSSNSSHQNLVYGEDIFICLNYGEDQRPLLYLQAESSSIANFSTALTCKLSAVPDVYCHFRILPAIVRDRAKLFGMDIQRSTNVIIQHMASGCNLAAEDRSWLPTLFGVECAVTCHTFKDSNRIETGENLWKISGKHEENLIEIQSNWDSPVFGNAE